MTTQHETFHIPLDVAEVYEERFVPAIFAEWAPHLIDAADVGPGDRVLDVACGTGIVARTAADRVGPSGRVAGLDLNESMLTVARRLRPDLDWHEGDAMDLPFPDRSFDAVVCQMALMFMPDRVRALREMGRVAADGGTVGVVVPAALSEQPAYGPFVETAVRHAGPVAASLLGTYWSCGDPVELTGLIEAAGLRAPVRRTRVGTARFATIDDLVTTEVEGSPLRDRISDAVYDLIRHDTRDVLAPYVTPTGADVPLTCQIVSARPR